MRYEEYIKSDHYKEQVIVDVVTAHVGILISILLLIVFPLTAVAIAGAVAWGPIIAVTILLLPFHLRSYQNLKRVDISVFKKSLTALLKLQWFQVTILTIFNIIVFVRIGFHTLIAPLYLLGAVVILSGIFYFKFKSRLMYYGIAPTIVSAFLLLNFVFSTEGSVEEYDLQPTYANGRDDSVIYLEDNIYREFIGIRVFSDYLEVKHANKVIYYFNDGLFGVKVMVDYKLLSH